jgi:hypothetical protein
MKIKSQKPEENERKNNIDIEQAAEAIAEIFLLQLQYEKSTNSTIEKESLTLQSTFSKNNLTEQVSAIKSKNSKTKL